MFGIMHNRSSIVKDFRKPFPYPLKHVVHCFPDVKVRPHWQIARETVTVCAGFIAKDGLLLAADTEITGSGKYDAQKIRKVKFPGGVYIVTGAGNLSFLGMTSDMIAAELRRAKRKLSGGLEKRKDAFFDLVQEQVWRVHTKHIAGYPYGDSPPWMSLIFGVQFEGEWNDPFLMHCAGDGGVYWAQDDVIEGSGAEIARRFSTILCRERLPLDTMRSIAIFCLYQAKQGAEGCGGSTSSFLFPAPKSNILWDEKPIARDAEESLRLSLVETRDRSVSLEQFKQRANDFVARLIAVKEGMERTAASQQFWLEMMKKRIKDPSYLSTVPQPPPEQSGGAAPGSGS